MLLYLVIIVSLVALGWYAIFIARIIDHCGIRHESKNLYTDDKFITVVIVARNESKNIGACIQSVLRNNYPKNFYEIIIVDDSSQDDTVEIASSFGENVKVFSLSDFTQNKKINAYKKEAIKYATSVSKGDILLLTDADCIVPENWISRTSHNFSDDHIVFQAGEVFFNPVNTFLDWFQQFDFLAMMGVTEAGINTGSWYLANGANMAFRKSRLPLDYYDEANNFASGDDVFLINKLAKNYSAESILFDDTIPVFTKPVPDLKTFISQRLRWSSKNKALFSEKTKHVLLSPVVINICLLFLLFASIFSYELMIIYAFVLCSKLVLDWSLIYFRFDHKDIKYQPRVIVRFIFSSILFPFYLIGIGFLSLFVKGHNWKDRFVT